MAQGNKTSKEQLITKWKSVFGEVDFSNPILFSAMVYIGPQPEDSLEVLAGKKIEPWVKSRGQEWFDQFMNDPFEPNLDSIKPKKYYLPRKNEARFLYYEWNTKTYHFKMYESYNGILLNIKNDSVKNFTTQTAEQFASLMISILNLRSKTQNSFKDEFGIREAIAPGLIFTNVIGGELGVVRDWQDAVVGFVTEKDINIICFKSSGMRAELSLPYVSDWLNSAIIDEKK